jgi:hypothetical protein
MNLLEVVQAQPKALPRGKDAVYIYRDALAQPLWYSQVPKNDPDACDYLYGWLEKLGAVYVERVIGWTARSDGERGWVPVSKMLARATPEGWVPM